jgi:DNA-binding CsgD family transcriptional regulator
MRTDTTIAERVAGLSPRQRQCLELVARGWEAKDIGRMLGISDLTVKNHLTAARATLGVSRSIDAARLVAAQADGDTDTPGTSAPNIIPDRSYLDAGPPGRSGEEPAGLNDAGYLHPRSPPLPFPTRRGQRNGLDIAARLAIVVGLTVLLIAAVGFFVEASRGLRM